MKSKAEATQTFNKQITRGRRTIPLLSQKQLGRSRLKLPTKIWEKVHPQ